MPDRKLPGSSVSSDNPLTAVIKSCSFFRLLVLSFIDDSVVRVFSELRIAICSRILDTISESSSLSALTFVLVTASFPSCTLKRL